MSIRSVRNILERPTNGIDGLRDLGPVVKIEKYGVWGMARYEQVSSALRDFDTYLSGRGMGLADLRKEPNRVLARRLTLEIDPPDHGKYRSVLMNVVSPQETRKLRDDFVRSCRHSG